LIKHTCFVSFGQCSSLCLLWWSNWMGCRITNRYRCSVCLLIIFLNQHHVYFCKKKLIFMLCALQSVCLIKFFTVYSSCYMGALIDDCLGRHIAWGRLCMPPWQARRIELSSTNNPFTSVHVSKKPRLHDIVSFVHGLWGLHTDDKSSPTVREQNWHVGELSPSMWIRLTIRLIPFMVDSHIKLCKLLMEKLSSLTVTVLGPGLLCWVKLEIILTSVFTVFYTVLGLYNIIPIFIQQSCLLGLWLQITIGSLGIVDRA